tara:strand:+ start:13512 stop:14480 length:969 start_codon:yes stop_codon:yes gene_type:complete
MTELKEYTAYIDKNLKDISFPSKPSALYDPIRYFLNIGGKRIRPILTLLGTELFGGNKEEAISQALSIEVFHNFTLVHDDIMDEAPLRRNQATIHHKWNTNVGILSGDVMMIKAYQLLCQINSKQLPEALNVFSTTAIEVCEGQQMDMDFESRNDVTVAEYIEMIRLKTSVLLGAALTIGAIVANASEKDKKNIYAFGQNIGIAFQIQDDILDLYADPLKFGKQVGGDVIANKKTILYLTALTDATKEQREILKQLDKEKDIELKITRTRQLFDQLKVKESCKERMQAYYSLAKENLDKINVPDENKRKLLELASFLMDREI